MPFPFQWPKHFDKDGILMAPGMSTHDHEIVIDSTTYHFWLARDNNGGAIYEVINSASAYEPVLRLAQTDWRGGHGVYWLPAAEGVNVYFDGQSIDTTQEGRVFLGPEINSPAVRNLVGVAVADDGTVLTTETTAARNITTNDMTLLPAVPAVNDAYYYGDDATFTTIWTDISTKGVGTWTIVWEYYNGSAWTALSGVTDNTTGFTAATGVRATTFTLPGDWATVAVNSLTKYWVRARVSVYSAVTTQPKGRQAWIGKSGLTMGENPAYFCWFPGSSSWFCATTTKIYEWAEGSTAWVQQYEWSGETISHLNVFGTVMYIGLGAATRYYYTTNGNTYTQTDLTDGYANRMLTSPNATGTADVLWKFKTPNEVQNTTDGRTVAAGGAQFDTVRYIGDSSTNIVSLFLLNDLTMAGREDNLFWWDNEGGIHPQMSELRNNRSTNNFKYVQPWRTSVYTSMVTGMGMFSAFNVFDPVGPLYNIGDIAKVGTVVGLGAEKDFLYVAMDEGTDTHIYKGSYQVDNQGNGRWSWCPWVFLSTNACAVIGLCQHTTTIRRLWFGYGNTAAYVVVTDNPTADSTARFAASGFVRMSYFDGGDRFRKYNDKLWQSIVTETKGCAAGITVTPKYRKDTDTSMTNLLASAISQNGVIETNISAQISSKKIQFELDLATNNSTITPEVLYFEARGVERPTFARIHDCVYSIAGWPAERVKTLRTNLRSSATSTSLIKFADIRYGDSTSTTNYVWVTVEPGFPLEREIVHTKGREPENGIQVRFKEVSYTIT